MSSVAVEVRRGSYHDSAVLMRLQRTLKEQEGVLEAGAVMATPANQALLREAGLDGDGMSAAGADDLLVVVRAHSRRQAEAALTLIDASLQRPETDGDLEYRPKTLAYAVETCPEAEWILISVPGEHAAGVAEQALDLERNVFLYSDNVSLEDERALKERARERLVMGPDCGTAIIQGMGFGFANGVRQGPVGLVGASGTGLQYIASQLDRAGLGVSQVYGCGGRDLDARIGGITTLQCLDRLAADPDTLVRVLVSKPPAPSVTRRVLAHLREQSKPTVVLFQGFAHDTPRDGPLHFADSLDQAAALACWLAARESADRSRPLGTGPETPSTRRWLRALFAGGTLAAETALMLARRGLSVADETDRSIMESPSPPSHTVLDLGADRYTRGRLHPMLDSQLRLDLLRQAVQQPDTALILFDIVLGYGAHANPAAEFAETIQSLHPAPDASSASPRFCALVVGAEGDPQDTARQIDMLREAGAAVFTSLTACMDFVVSTLDAVEPATAHDSEAAFINVGLSSFGESLRIQGARVVQVDWSPPPAMNPAIGDILARMRRSG